MDIPTFTLAGSVAIDATELEVDAAAPAGLEAPFYATIDNATADEEVILVTAIDATTWTIERAVELAYSAQTTVTTTPKAHASGRPIEPGFGNLDSRGRILEAFMFEKVENRRIARAIYRAAAFA